MQAAKARDGMYNLVWPEKSPKKLIAEFSNQTAAQVAAVAREKREKRNAQKGGEAVITNRDRDRVLERQQEKDKLAQETKLRAQLKEREIKAGSPRASGAGSAEGKQVRGRTEEKPPVTLDQLFRKTDFGPKLYWLPVSEQQAKEARAKKTAPLHHDPQENANVVME
jgi:hypothetical protein